LAKGIKTYVVGIPGSSPYATLLNQLAVAGGTARAGMSTSYYDVEHISELDDVLASIGATVTSSCHVKLAAPPLDSHLVNVYLDGHQLNFGADGWTWADVDAGSADDAGDAVDLAEATPPPVPHTAIDLVGTACEMLTSGRYRRLQVVYGCPTDIPR
jgi:hypothetical protein